MQTNASMVPFLVDTLEQIIREFYGKFILDEVMKRSTSTTKLIKLNALYKNIQKVNVDLGFALKEQIKLLKKEENVKETKLHFCKNVKNFLSALCDHLLTKTPLQSHFCRCCCCFLKFLFFGRLPIIIQKAF